MLRNHGNASECIFHAVIELGDQHVNADHAHWPSIAIVGD
jgi:hypothetical protein